MNKVTIGFVGITGRVGQEVEKLIQSSSDMELLWGVSRKESFFSDENDPRHKSVDVVLDFSSPSALFEVIRYCERKMTPIVVGTTGLEVGHFSELRRVANKIPVLYSANMSLGVALLSKALEVFKNQSSFDYQIEEIHHAQKKDRPSGTALYLKDVLSKIIHREIDTPASLRGGGVFGVHKVYAFSSEESIVFEHTALNRAVFARGALSAALWLKRQQPGFYSMSDFMNRP